ncbi:hypothetical protein GA707_15245 [Nostocoides sp. F2B08]|uniref:hypothetical protein n=1 Tax=Nostocoides sp. F2B08 TaxID=2653936 RepID=UPI001262EB57|nr:hypothetical protein [Tetrasphaera sp. F2B08]KAB7743002.1 hypothetical protein GA707_15245 [Tetrasphaera sp. F2B08]
MRETPALAAIKTYRYLRLALVGLVVLLFAALAIEWLAVDRECVQPTISAYWHTPGRAVLVGVLVTMGICLIALKGNDEAEDVLLNLAGILAPGVAFVPTTAYSACSSSPAGTGQDTASISNNMQALFVLGAVAVVVALVIARGERGRTRRLSTWDRVGLFLGFAATAGGALWFYLDRDGFVAHAHNVAAVPMFLAIVAAVWVNARDVQETIETHPALRAVRGRYSMAYRSIAVAMLATLVLAVVGHLGGWTNALLVVEILLIALFAAFWVIQTRELWNQGLREAE